MEQAPGRDVENTAFVQADIIIQKKYFLSFSSFCILFDAISFVCSVTRCWNKQKAKKFPKFVTLTLMFFKILQKLDCFCNKICQQELSQISKSDHTVCVTFQVRNLITHSMEINFISIVLPNFFTTKERNCDAITEIYK